MAKKLQGADLIGKAIVKGNMSYNVKGAEGDTLTVESVTGDRTTAMPPMSMEQVEKLLAGGWTVSDTQAQPATVEEVEEVSAITPTKPAVIEAINKAATEGKATTMPLGSHGTLIIASGGGEKPTTPTKPTGEKLTEVRLVVYTTARTQQQAPRIEGFAGEDDPRWKKHYDEKQRLKDLKADAEKKNDRLRKAMKGKTKAEKEAMMAQWVVVPNDPFNASYFTDRTTGEKTYSLVMGAKYLDVAQQLVDAYNTDDREAWAKAEQAVQEVKSSVVAEAVAERQAKREERQAKREAEKGKTEQPTPAATVQGYTDKDVADMLKRIMAGEAIPENIKLAMAA